MNYKQWLKKSSQRLKNSLNKEAKLDAEILLVQVTGKTKTDIIAFDDTDLTDKQCYELEKLLIRREQGEPMAYIIGEWEFWSLKLKISNDVIVPRPDTEFLVSKALSLFPNDNIKVLDLGTGSGAISLALAVERSNWSITGIDCINKAIILAKENARKLRLNNVKFYCCDWSDLSKVSYIENYYDLIISNPPYISSEDPVLLEDGLRFEPKIALVAHENGFGALKEICNHSKKYLRQYGWLILEHGCSQGFEVRNIMSKINLKKIMTFYDYNNYERVTQGQNSYY